MLRPPGTHARRWVDPVSSKKPASMLFAHKGKRPAVDPSARIAPNATICGDRRGRARLRNEPGDEQKPQKVLGRQGPVVLERDSGSL
jgi:hypothetical protein